MLSLDSLTIQYGSRVVLHDITLEVRSGEVLALIGPNGVGKSTLIHAASGGLKPARGQVTIEGQDESAVDRVRRNQRVEAFTAFDTVLMGRTAYVGWLGRESEKDRSIALQAMDRTNTLDLAARRIGELSGGEQQRVLIARALAQSTLVLLMDEPTAHLDLKHQADILNLVCSLAHAENLAVMIALHDLNLAAQYADRVALLSNSRLVALGQPEEVLTTESLSPVYGLRISVYPHPVNGSPLVLADVQK